MGRECLKFHKSEKCHQSVTVGDSRKLHCFTYLFRSLELHSSKLRTFTQCGDSCSNFLLLLRSAYVVCGEKFEVAATTALVRPALKRPRHLP